MSDMTLLKCLRDLTHGDMGPGGKPFTVHGFRSSLTDWAADQTEFSKEVVDKAKAHKTPDATEAAYRRTTYLGTRDNPGPRVRLMDAWGEYCSSGSGSNGQ
jgi:integrase